MAPRILRTAPDCPRTMPRIGVVLAHGAGVRPERSFLALLAKSLARRDAMAFRFQFPFCSAHRAFPDSEPVLRRAFYTVAAEARRFLARGAVLIAGGRALGARISSIEAADTGTWFADGLVLVSYPLWAKGRRDPRPTEHWPWLEIPTLFVTGMADSFAPRTALLTAQRRMPSEAENLWIPGAGRRLLDVKGTARRARIDAVADRIVEFALRIGSSSSPSSPPTRPPPPTLPSIGRSREWVIA